MILGWFFFFCLFLSFKGLAWELERGLSSEEPLPLFKITQVWFSVLTSASSELPATPAPKDLTSSSGLLGHLHTCYANTHTHKIKFLLGIAARKGHRIRALLCGYQADLRQVM